MDDAGGALFPLFLEKEIKAKAGNSLQIREYGEKAVRRLRETSLCRTIIQKTSGIFHLSISKAVDMNGEAAACWQGEKKKAGRQKSERLNNPVPALRHTGL